MTSEEIRIGLERLGFRPGMRLMVHSSLSSFGWVEGGAESVIRALMKLVGPEGTILMPSFNHGAPFKQGGSGIFDPLQTPCYNGRIPDTFWRMPGVYRSLNPTHPYAAWGADAERYTKHHHLTLTMGEDSPLGLLTRDGGCQLNLGTNHGATTAKHLAETLRRVPCLGYRTGVHPVRLHEGKIVEYRTWTWRERSCPLTESGKFIEIEMERRKLQKKNNVGSCVVTHFKLKDLMRTTWELLENGYAGYPPCSRCPIRSERTSTIQPSDWVENPKILYAARQQILGA